MSAEYRPVTAAESVRAIGRGVDPWIAFGQLLDDWRRTPLPGRAALVADPPEDLSGEDLRWCALIAAAVESLCAADGIGFPAWTSRDAYRLASPWFLYPGWRLRMWQLVDTPAPFKARNIFGGDRILSRV